LAEKFLSRHGIKPRIGMEIGSNETIKQAVMAGMGVSFLSLRTIGLELATGRLSVLSVMGMSVMRDWYIIHRERKQLAPAATAFKNYLIAEGSRLIERAVR
jgi:LysR family transcriptional regulator, low CO2-responsive transcriptional regulator